MPGTPKSRIGILRNWKEKDKMIKIENIEKSNKKIKAEMIRLSKKIALKIMHVLTDYDNFNQIKYINVLNKYKKNKVEVMGLDQNKVASKIRLSHSDYDNFNQIKYINVSVYDNLQRYKAPVVSKVRHQPDELGPLGHLGSNPSWGASASYFEKTKK